MIKLKTLGVATVVSLTAIFAAPSVSPVSSFVETFDGSPTTPTPWDGSNWEVTYVGDEADPRIAPGNLSQHAQHGADCSAPTNSHAIASLEASVFQCNGHIMSALDAPGYAVNYLTPNKMIDFSTGTATFKFDMSTEVTSLRDWVDIWLTPYGDNLQLVGEDWYPDLAGLPRNGVTVRIDGSKPSVKIIEDFAFRQFSSYPSSSVPGNWWTGYETFLTPSRIRRDTFELQISKTHIKFGMPQYNFWWVDADIAPLNFDLATIQIGHHSYNPTKDCTASSLLATADPCKGNTWHFDNVSIDPSLDFDIIDGATNSYANNQSVTFDRSAPAGSELHFIAIQGSSPQVSFNGGTSWVTPTQTPSSLMDHGKYRAYKVPAPVGTSTVRFRGVTNIYGQPFVARDASIWSRDVVTVTSTTVPVTTSTTSTTVPVTTTTTVPATTTTVPATTTTTTTPPPVVCTISSPTGVTVSTNGSGTLLVNWAYSSSKTYELRFRKVGATTWGTRTLSVVAPYTLRSLTRGAQYEVQVREVSPWSPQVVGSAGV